MGAPKRGKKEREVGIAIYSRRREGRRKEKQCILRKILDAACKMYNAGCMFCQHDV